MLKSESQNKNFEEYLKLEFVLSNLIKYRFMLSILQQDGGLLPPPISSSYSPPLVWLWGGFVTFEIEIGDGPLTFILMLKSLGVGGGGGWSWIIASALVLF